MMGSLGNFNDGIMGSMMRADVLNKYELVLQLNSAVGILSCFESHVRISLCWRVTFERTS